MTRVTTSGVRQVVLTSGDPLQVGDDTTGMETIQLYNDLGQPVLFQGGMARFRLEERTDTILASGAVETNLLELYPSVRLFKIATDIPARIRIYPTAAMRDADVLRPIGVKPRGNHGRLFEVVTTPELLEFLLTPEVDMTSDDVYKADFYTSVTNLSPYTDSVLVTYNYCRTE